MTIALLIAALLAVLIMDLRVIRAVYRLITNRGQTASKK